MINIVGNVFKINEKKNLWFFISLCVIGIGFFIGGLKFTNHQPIFNLGIDFAGGSTIMLKYSDAVDRSISTIDNQSIVQNARAKLETIGLGDSTIILTSNQEIIIKTPEKSPDKLLVLRQLFEQEYEFLSSDYIGPTIGAELKQKSILIIITVSILLLLYISWRFEFLFGLSALLAVLHDALIVLSLSIIFQFEINTAYVAALLTILGYSINDTIIIFDRIRENLTKKKLQGQSITHISNVSVSQTLLRSINTSITTLAVVCCLIFFGGTTVKEFCIILSLGILSGTYSSIFIASPFYVVLKDKYSSTTEVVS